MEYGCVLIPLVVEVVSPFEYSPMPKEAFLGVLPLIRNKMEKKSPQPSKIINAQEAYLPPFLQLLQMTSNLHLRGHLNKNTSHTGKPRGYTMHIFMNDNTAF